MKKTIIVLVVILIIIAMLIVVGKRILFPRYDEIEVTGKYETACEDYWVTEDKADPFLNDGSLREVQVRAWYQKGRRACKKMRSTFGDRNRKGCVTSDSGNQTRIHQ